MGLNHAIAPRRLKPFRAFLPDRLRGRLKGRASGKRLKDRIKRSFLVPHNLGIHTDR